MGAGIYERREVSNLREHIELLKQQQNAPADQLQQLTRERDNALRQLADLREDNDRVNRNAAELIRLRGEVGRLRQNTRELEESRASEVKRKEANANQSSAATPQMESFTRVFKVGTNAICQKC